MELHPLASARKLAEPEELDELTTDLTAAGDVEERVTIELEQLCGLEGANGGVPRLARDERPFSEDRAFSERCDTLVEAAA